MEVDVGNQQGEAYLGYLAAKESCDVCFWVGMMCMGVLNACVNIAYQCLP